VASSAFVIGMLNSAKSAETVRLALVLGTVPSPPMCRPAP
jgi:hypothetical protein